MEIKRLNYFIFCSVVCSFPFIVSHGPNWRQLEHATLLQQQYHQHTEVSCSLYETAKLFIECQTIGTKVPKETEDLFKRDLVLEVFEFSGLDCIL